MLKRQILFLALGKKGWRKSGAVLTDEQENPPGGDYDMNAQTGGGWQAA